MERRTPDAIETESKSSQIKSCIFSFHKMQTKEPSSKINEVGEWLYFVYRLSKGGYAAIFAESCMIEKWIIAVILSGLL